MEAYKLIPIVEALFKIENLSLKTRENIYTFARHIYFHHLVTSEGMSRRAAGETLGRSSDNVDYCLREYEKLLANKNFNHKFDAMVQKFNNKIKFLEETQEDEPKNPDDRELIIPSPFENYAFDRTTFERYLYDNNIPFTKAHVNFLDYYTITITDPKIAFNIGRKAAEILIDRQAKKAKRSKI